MGIPIALWECLKPHSAMGIPIVVWGGIGKNCGLGIPIALRESLRFGDQQIYLMRSLEIAKLTPAAITVQSMCRSWKCQKELMQIREQAEQAQAVLATIKIQAFFRASQYQKVLSLRKCLTLEKDRQDEWHRRVHASGKIQAVVRTLLSRHNFLRHFYASAGWKK